MLDQEEERWQTPMLDDGRRLSYMESPTDSAETAGNETEVRQRPSRGSDNMPLRKPRPPGGYRRREPPDIPPPKGNLPIRKRLKHVTWAWFTMVMATGGIASTLRSVPFYFDGLYAIGVFFFLAALVFFLVIWGMIFLRFYNYPYMFKLSFQHPTESLFIPAVAVAFGTILINIVEYGSDKVGRWLNRAILALFWFDSALAVFLSITIYLILWSTQSYTIARMTPIWIFPAYPMLIIGPHAAALAPELTNPREALAVIIGGFTVQGIGFLVSVTVYSAFVYRLMTQKLPAEPLRPGMFVSVGPSAFTASGVIGMASSFDTVLTRWPEPLYMNMDPKLSANILTIIGNWMSLWLWGLALWFFFVSLFANIVCLRRPRSLPFAMTWYSFVFPQTALTKATFRVADAFDAFPLQIIGCVMTVALIIVWALVIVKMVHAIYKKQILWPETGEDKTEGGFSMPKDEEEREALGDAATTTPTANGETLARS